VRLGGHGGRSVSGEIAGFWRMIAGMVTGVILPAGVSFALTYGEQIGTQEPRESARAQ
jgi:hypothetical protein